MHDEIDVRQYFQRTGAIGLIAELDREDGLIVEDLQERLGCARQTASDRINEAQENDLIERMRKPYDHGNSKRVRLTKRGVKLRKEIVRMGLDQLYTQKVAIESEYSEKSQDLLQWVNEHPKVNDPRYPYEPDYDPREPTR